MSMNVRVGGAWKDISAVSVRVGGAWKNVSQAYVRVGGVWKEMLGRVKTLAVSYRDYVTTAATQSSFTYTSRDIGSNTSHPDRKAYVLVQNRHLDNALTVPTAVTVGGVGGTQVAAGANRLTFGGGAIGYLSSSIWEIATTGLGSTANIVVTFAGNQSRCTIGVYEALDAVVIDTDDLIDGSTVAPSGVSITLDTQSPGAVILLGVGHVDDGATTPVGFTARQNNILETNTDGSREYTIVIGDDLAPSVSTDTYALTLASNGRSEILGISLGQAA